MAALKLKRAVSKKKRRFQADGYDLDLSYVTERVVAMGFPSEGTEGIYRNRMTDVVRFFDERHEGHYKVYNLCSERQYDHAKFHGRVSRFPFDDHNPPPIGMMLDFCRDIEQWFAESEDNVAVVHCKAGKGRTGVMIACWLQYGGMWGSALEALAYYGAARTRDQKGVTIPSQIRYVTYFESIVREGGLRSEETLFLKRLRLCSLPMFKQLHFVVQHGFTGKNKVFVSSTLKLKKGMECPLDWDVHVPLVGECKFVFYEKKDKAFSFWINASYIDDGFMRIVKSTMDGAIKDKKHKVFPEEFAVELYVDAPSVPVKPSGGPLGLAAGTAAADAYFEDIDKNVELADDEDELAQAEAVDKAPATAAAAAPAGAAAGTATSTAYATAASSSGSSSSGSSDSDSDST
eukprot:c53487_g1_i1.p1 GENE.c53487_g1_i1~~c53487_g1_i1.p1  ORF type:complete len:404 (-),score=90.23 c53487_g1_i1:36-1247(-)